MTLRHIKASIAAAWLLGAAAIGAATGTDTTSGWMALITLGVAPPLGMWLLWNDPEPTMTETIRQGRG